MRIALIADIHGNLFPLEAVVRDIRHRDVQATVCLGDTVTVGNQPLEVLELLKELKCSCIMGNHDEAILYPQKATELNIPAELVRSLEWTLKRITKEEIEFISSFKKTLSLKMENDVELHCYHGSPSASYELISQTMPEADLAKIFEKTNAGILAGGHIHQPMMRRIGSRILINPGSVGCAWVWIGQGMFPILQPWAEYAIVDVKNRCTNIEMIRVSFDNEKAKKAMSGTDNPLKEWLQKQYCS
jgi:putative phosphoesterase